MQRAFLIICACLTLLASGCGSDSSSTGEDTSAAEAREAKAEEAQYEEELEAEEEQEEKLKASKEAAPKIKVPKGPPPKKLEIKELKKGSGPAAEAGDEVTVNYVGVLYKNGDLFDSSWARAEPFTFKLGENLVIQGWEKGLAGMKAGGRRQLIIPPQLGYGSQATVGIPANSTLVFVVDMVEVGNSGAKKTKPKVEVPKGSPPQELVIKDLEEGSGPEAKPGDEVTVHYVGVNYKTGKQFDASWDRGEPFTFMLGEGLVVEGWEKGIPGMKPGGRRELIIPPDQGYGYSRTEGIPPGSTLVFVVDLVSVK